MSAQPEALRLAEHLENFRSFPNDMQAAAELRRLHALNSELLGALRDLLRRIADDEEYGPDHAVTKARAAIAKATD